MKTLWCIAITATLLISIQFPWAQTPALDSLQTERVLKTSQLWGHLKYFHPYLAEKTIDWESAYTNYIEEVIRAKNSLEYGNAVQKMLDHLNDPATKVLASTTTSGNTDTLKYPVISFIEDSVLLISVRDYSDLEDFNYVTEQFESVKTKGPQSKGIIFDLRSANDIGEFRGYLSWYFNSLEANLATTELHLPGFRGRFHDGFVPEEGASSGGYTNGFYTKDARTITPAPTAFERPMIFIVNQHTEIPICAVGLQSAGKAKILSVGTLTDASVVAIFNFELDDSVQVAIRVNSIATDKPLAADHLMAPTASENEVKQIAVQMINEESMNNAHHQKAGSETGMQENKLTAQMADSNYPDLGHRLLAAAKIWTVIDYFFAYKELMDDDWESVFRKSIPDFARASDSLQYAMAVARMYTHLDDGHGFIRSTALRQYFGRTVPPVFIRFIEDKPVVTCILPDSVYEVKGVDIGDIILEIDGERTDDRIERFSEYINASNRPTLLNYISWRILNGPDSSEIRLKIQKVNGKIENVTLPRRKAFAEAAGVCDDVESPITRLINPEIGYADLDRLTSEMVDKMFEDFKDTKAIIFDMRGYPNGTAWSISPHLTDKKDVYAASFRRYSPMGIQTGHSSHLTLFDQPLPSPRTPYYQGKTVMLIDERTQSQAEHTGLFFEAANGTKFIGSQTAGANGDVTNFRIPGQITLFFSGHDVRHADGRQLQRIGLVPDVFVKPTIKGIAEGKDEVLERAIEYVEKLIVE